MVGENNDAEKTNSVDEKPNNDSHIIPKLIEEEMKQSYLDYSMSVIVGRALPDVRDGLKPVHRRILFGMSELGLVHNKPYKKSARIVGDVLGKYHPHGDTAVYDALVRMAQYFSLRYPLVDGQGNYGSIDGDNAASMRYTEARLNKIAEEILEDLDKETVKFTDNFDGSLKEPEVLPSKIPNLLINGSSGIAVGMATNIPPHNLREICKGAVEMINNPELNSIELMQFITGPDFPTGGVISGKQGIMLAYKTGNGRLAVRAKYEVEQKGDKKRIIINEIPYMVDKSSLMLQIAEMVKDKIIDGISDLRDESDREGMRIVIELKKNALDDIVLNKLLKHTKLRVTFGVQMLALVDNQPVLLDLKNMLLHFINHRKTIVTKRTEYDLRKAEERYHILQGLVIALDDIDNAIQIIKKASSADEASQRLQARYNLTEIQCRAILDMKLQKLTSLEQGKIRQEQMDLEKNIAQYKIILGDEKEIFAIIKRELNEVSNAYGDERKTEIEDGEEEYIDIEDLIKPEDVVITITNSGYIKRVPVEMYKSQNRGGAGVIGTTTKEEDNVENLFVANTHDYLLCFSDDGKIRWLKAYEVPEGSRISKGKAIVNLLEIESGIKTNAVIPVKTFEKDKYLFFVTKDGYVKKTSLELYSHPRAGGINAIGMREGDKLVNVMLTDGNKNIIVGTKEGMAIQFNEMDVRPMGRSATGVIGIRLSKSDEVIGSVIADKEKTILTITENGYGKRTSIEDYRIINRGGKGVINIQCTERNGNVVSIKSITDEDEVMLISKNGIIIRILCRGVNVIGRNTQGVRLMKLKEGDKVIGAAKIINE